LVKGFKDSNNKFHPITDYKKGTRKSRDQSAKTIGIRLKRKNSPRIPFKTLDNTENQLYRIRDELSDQMEQETWSEVNELIDKIQNYKMKYYGRTGIRKARYAFGDDEEPQEITPDYSVGDIVMVSSDNDNEGYDDFRNKKLRITMVATNTDEHRGFDEGVGQALYELETLDGEEIGSSLYDYELESA